ncbi:MAG: GNAT family N-acetyltransferase, partial [Silvanigrellaceae bacterium]|nr:GNAT family N-acetyltransferase [Silvanigrellaceae bacterium]
LSSQISSDFYSQNEFELAEFLKIPGNKLELGRACIHPTHRNGTLKDLLWKGISEYIKCSHSDILFGCSSVMTTSPQVIFKLLDFFKSKNLHSAQYSIHTKEKYVMPFNEGQENHQNDNDNFLGFLPPLLKGYFLAGAKVYGSPAFDQDFMCTDFFTILFLKDLNASFQKRYMKN